MSAWSRTGWFKVFQLEPGWLTFGVVAGLKHMQLMGVVSEGEDFDHWVQDHHNPEHKGVSTQRLKFKLIVQKCNTNQTLPADNKWEGMTALLVQNCCAIKLRNILKGRCKPETKHILIYWLYLKRRLPLTHALHNHSCCNHHTWWNKWNQQNDKHDETNETKKMTN